LLSDALDRPVGAAPLTAGGRVVVVVSDATRHEPRAEMISAVLSRLGDADITIAIANGTHGPCELSRLGLDASLLARARVVNHDAEDDAELVSLGATRRGTPLRVNRCLVEADQLVATGRIKPHYFAGFGAGAKAFFPGLGGNREVRINHRLKTNPGARAGVVEGNPCREDLEEIVDALPVRPFLLNVVTDAAGGAQAAVAGDVREAFRRGAELCAPLFRADLPEADVIVVSDELPLAGNLYQASKLVASVAPRLRPGGHIVLAAECPEGTGPIRVVNEAIYEIGLKPRLPAEHTVHLVSSLPAAVVEGSYCVHAPSVESVLELAGGGRIAVLPRAGDVILSA
jgi:nickel-dependent lactate racemase